ncbi:hypothetical protein UA08_05372 [Talaromyces atroroseus]|uniref:Acyltransferase MbtK/IucB-like conserved domain-containing protein n=1 Tax=Talaromyces atroroseus TaxID=1441469 RepID=A0A225APW9_TALAT|nr:hypothetical protein UA08_05372 [Talaromyces atroroseus]OKL59308.1 hypothetical protein UA08_05372 [Talaromyces atroroseus]
MHSPICHLPNGNTFSVTPVFGGFTFKETDSGVHNTTFPPGWTVVIHTEKPVEDGQVDGEHSHDNEGETTTATTDTNASERKVRISSFKKPTLQNDCIFISSINSPSSSDYKTPISPSRQIAMMLWATLLWYFHEPQPDPRIMTEASALTSELGRPKGEWRVNIKREGIFKGRNLLQKLERMGLISNEDSSVGTESIESRNPANWARMFTSRRSFWQLDPRMFIFTLTPTNAASFSPINSPYNSRPASPSVESLRLADGNSMSPTESSTPGHVFSSIGGPFYSGSHLPTFYPPAPTQYVFTNGIRHPLRQRPPHQGETFYTRYIPSVGQYLSFRVPVLSTGKTGGAQHSHTASSTNTPSSLTVPPARTSTPPGVSDVELLNKWMNNPRVNAAWGEAGPRSSTEEFLKRGLNDRHSFPVFGCWGGKPFGYFEIYWVKEDPLGRLLNNVGNYDRGLHVLVGEEEFRGSHRLHVWLSSLVHYCWLADPRTETVLLEPRVDNKKLISYLTEFGFFKEGERMPLTVLTAAQVRALLLSLSRDDIITLQRNLAEALREYSTGTHEQGCSASYQPHRTAITGKDGNTTVFMPASTGKTTGVKILSSPMAPGGLDPVKPGCSTIGQELLGGRQSAKVSFALDESSSRRSSSSLSTDLSSMSLSTSHEGNDGDDDSENETSSFSSSTGATPSINQQSLTAQPSNVPSSKSLRGVTQVTGKAWPPTGARDSSPRGTLTLVGQDGLPIGLISAQDLTAFRTALTSLCVFNKRKHVKTITVFGAGRQAYWHIRLALLLRGPEVKRVYIVNRSFDRAANLLKDIYSAGNASWRSDVKFHAFSSDFVEYNRLLREAVRKADAIFCCTPSLEPLFPAEFLTSTEGRRKGRLISAIGSYKSHMTELHPDILRYEVKPASQHSHHYHKHAQRGGVVLVDSLEMCLQEAGEIVQAELGPHQLVEIGELMIMKHAARLSPVVEQKGAEEGEKGLQRWLESGNVVYKSVGLGLMDLVTGGDLVDFARARGIGTVIDDFE